MRVYSRPLHYIAALMLVTALPAAMLTMPDVAFAKDNGNGKGGGNGQAKGHDKGPKFSQGNAAKPAKVKVKAAKVKSMPPGLAKKAGFSPLNDDWKGGRGDIASRLGGLNSLWRNINAIERSNDPKLAPFRDYIQTYGTDGLTLEKIEELQAEYDAASLKFSDDLDRTLLTPYDGAEEAYGDYSWYALQNRRDYLQGLLDSGVDNPAIVDEIIIIDNVLASDDLAAYSVDLEEVSTQLEEMEYFVAQGRELISDEELRAALADAE